MKFYGLIIPLGLVVGTAAIAQAVSPIAPVPRFGSGSPVYTGQQSPAPHRALRLGRAGPPGSVLPSGQVGPNCMTPLWKNGFHANHVECPLYLPARPGATEQCTASDASGRVRTLTVTFLDWDANTNTGSVDCSLNPRQ